MTTARRKFNAVPDGPLRIVLYGRVSALMGRDPESDEFHSTELQVSSMRHAFAPLGVREVQEPILDVDVSGQTFDREGTDRILELADARAIDAVGLPDLSRLGRNALESLQFIKKLRDLGIIVMSAKERIDDSPQGQFMLGVFLHLAELFGKQIGQRWAELAAKQALQGLHHGVAPLGYYKVKRERAKDGTRPPAQPLKVDPVVGRLVTRAFRQFANDVPVSVILRRFCEGRGKDTPYATLWRILRNPAYLGHVTLHGKVFELPDGKFAHPPLVDAETWERVCARAERDGKTPARLIEPSHSLVSLARCVCTSPMHKWNDTRGKTQGRGEPVISRLKCGKQISRARGAGRCKGVGLPSLAKVEKAVLEKTEEFLGKLKTDHVTRAETIARRDRAVVDVERLKRELRTANDALASLTIRLAKENISQAAYDVAAARLEEDVQRLTDSLDANQTVVRSPAGRKKEQAIETLLRLWPDATPAERNMMLRPIVDKVTIRRGVSQREPMKDRVTVDFL